eukprot:2809253-Heterocapsa_arctica.AAC.1
MEFYIDGSAYNKCRLQTMDKKECGGFEHIVMWSRIYCVKIENYSVLICRQLMEMNSCRTHNVSYYCTATKADGENS